MATTVVSNDHNDIPPEQQLTESSLDVFMAPVDNSTTTTTNNNNNIDPTPSSVSDYFAFQRRAALWLCFSVVVVFIATTFLVGFINRN